MIVVLHSAPEGRCAVSSLLDDGSVVY